jgi:hypothetical protein
VRQKLHVLLLVCFCRRCWEAVIVALPLDRSLIDELAVMAFDESPLPVLHAVRHRGGMKVESG